MTRFTYVGEHVWPGDEFEGEIAWHGMSFCYSFSEGEAANV